MDLQYRVQKCNRTKNKSSVYTKKKSSSYTKKLIATKKQNKVSLQNNYIPSVTGAQIDNKIIWPFGENIFNDSDEPMHDWHEDPTIYLTTLLPCFAA